MFKRIVLIFLFIILLIITPFSKFYTYDYTWKGTNINKGNYHITYIKSDNDCLYFNCDLEEKYNSELKETIVPSLYIQSKYFNKIQINDAYYFKTNENDYLGGEIKENYHNVSLICYLNSDLLRSKCDYINFKPVTFITSIYNGQESNVYSFNIEIENYSINFL